MLYDSHGHDHAHDPSEATVLTYGGVVTPDRIVLPVVQVLAPRATADRHRHSGRP
ncbi:hypothetical protein H4CHR_04614 [Variovorax sp. PBS-H4]|uniref:hypothetical protein n=1 Tax=Variovorax sp. PBS-H4 TaxID=434008 RepID=UPI0013195120|nr:hypothetical protein [Variovorax sp. PBS-H4]VTU39172.1 hypothetical protein H4CHR_04614 [Variovorax sp. PBS-H4]